jgi:exosortase
LSAADLKANWNMHELSMGVNMLATDASQSIQGTGSRAIQTLWQQGQSKERLWALAAVILVFSLAYFGSFRTLVTTWYTDQNYSHGFLIIPIAVGILWQRLRSVQPDSSAGAVPAAWWGWVFLTAVLAVRAFAYEWNSQGLENITLLLAIPCLVWTFGGWPLLRRIWLAIGYLVFMFPLPPTINSLVALPLQRIATTGSCFLLQLSGLWAIQDGNVINLDTKHDMVPLDVALACNGLRMLMTMVATVMAIVILVPMPTWKRIVLLITAVPIALLSNIMRIAITGWCYYLIQGPNFKEWAHDVSGWLMMPVALAFVGIELGILSWLAPARDAPREGDEKPILFMPPPKAKGLDREEELPPVKRK